MGAIASGQHVALLVALVGFGVARSARAGDGSPNFLDAPAAPGVAIPDPERRERREDRLGVLAVYAVVAAAAVGGSYLLRDDVFGRSLAVTAAGWGGLTLGAAAGAGLSALGGCRGQDCGAGQDERKDEGDVAIAVGGLLGSAAGSIAGYLLTSHVGRSRVYTTGAGMTPFLLIFGAATIAQW